MKTIKPADSASPPKGIGEKPRAIEDILEELPPCEATPELRDAVTAMRQDIIDLRAELRDAKTQMADMERLADRDPMVDLFNRRAFIRELSRVIAMVDRYEQTASLVFVDLNGLKQINDSRGHRAGDAAIKHVAEHLSSQTRQTDIVARLGGDEFAILLTHIDGNQAKSKMQELADLISKATIDLGEDEFKVTVAFGCVEILAEQSADDLMERADAAMYRAKRNS